VAKHPGNAGVQRLKVWRALCGWWLAVGIVGTDATVGVKRPKVARTEGHAPWTRADLAKFRARWPIGTPERLAMEFIYWTGARVGDSSRASETWIDKDGWMRFTQQKTGGPVCIPITAPAPAWAEPDGLLAACLDARPVRHLALMVTAYGKPRTVAGATQWFAAAARKAGVDKAAHGLRKLRAQIMAENGATTHQIAAWTGHESLSEVADYSRAADRKRIIAGTESANFGESAKSAGEGA
jgi:integrase